MVSQVLVVDLVQAVHLVRLEAQEHPDNLVR